MLNCMKEQKKIWLPRQEVKNIGRMEGMRRDGKIGFNKSVQKIVGGQWEKTSYG